MSTQPTCHMGYGTPLPGTLSLIKEGMAVLTHMPVIEQYNMVTVKEC